MKSFDDGEGGEFLTAHYDTDGGVRLAANLRDDLASFGDTYGDNILARAYVGALNGAAAAESSAVAPPTPRRAALNEAADLIDGGREKDYGPPSVNFQRIAQVWDVIVPKPGGWKPAEVATAMIGLKLARTPEAYKRDTYLDIAGYAALAIELEET